MKVLIAPDKFKGSCTSVAAAEAIARGLRRSWPDAELRLAPIADGGEGFLDAVHGGLGGEWIVLEVSDPLGRKVRARYLWVEQQKLAVIGVSEASGLWRLAATECDPVRATSFGTGELMLHAAERGARTILVGLGGSATTDGGVGIAAALGYEMITSDGERYDVGSGALREIARIRRPENATELPPVIAASDVESPLLGVRGTARVFSPQKGADAETIETLELGLQHLCDIVRRDLGSDFADVPGAGAAGGIGFGLLSFCSAEIRSGFDVVAEMLGLEELIGWADLIITGEGRIDVQTLEGKGPAGVARLAKRHGKPVVAFAGSVAADVSFADLFNAIYAVIDEPADLDEARRRGEEFLERAAERAAKLMQVGAELRHASS